MAKNLFQAFYFTFAIIYGLKVMRGSPWLPPSLGGTEEGDILNCIKNVPFVKPIEGALTYALVMMGYHAGDLFHHVFIHPKQNDYYEMLLHHMTTLCLCGSMIYANQLAIGCIITLLHDFADLPGVLAKILAETKYVSAAAVVFVSCILSWIWTRNIMLTRIVYLIITEW